MLVCLGACAIARWIGNGWEHTLRCLSPCLPPRRRLTATAAAAAVGTGMSWVESWGGVVPAAPLTEEEIAEMDARYGEDSGLTPIFHKRNGYGNKVSHAGL